ncbi:MAG: protein kinase domain-containing protein, partial [Planctomycetaceae bacterium]
AGLSLDLADWQRRFPGCSEIVLDAARGRTDSAFEVWVESLATQRGVQARILPQEFPKLTRSQTAFADGPPDNDPALLTNVPLPIRFEARRMLGEGGFGTVYLAYDTDHRRLVAVKCIRADRCRDASARAMLRREAELAASLRHPGIVEIRELLEHDESLLIVEEYLPGGDLRSRIVPGGLPLEQVVDWMIAVGQAVAFGHQHDLIHRDLKPGNILLDERGCPRVADFGLALRDAELREERLAQRRSGTLAYMSPEQIRGESHRIDGRSDTWSLGVVLYELLTGRRPFRGTKEQIVEQIRSQSPRLLRELRPAIPVELERICFKCLQRRQADRYSTVADLIEDLRALRGTMGQLAGDLTPPPIAAVVPQGLRAFEARDHRFFLELLPGPRDRDGLPESLRFWKQAIESPPPDLRLAVGVWHGPSGCGKSSLLRAGLLPCLAPGVVPVLVEASAHQTEARLMSALRLRIPSLTQKWTLPEALAAIRDGRVASGGHKLLLVLDQFEQWLQQGSPVAPAGELLDALRQCDGQHLQALLLVRDDFWPQLLRLMDRLEIPSQSHSNTLAVELFEPAHARRVLVRFGQAYGALPREPEALRPEQEQFLDSAIEALTDRGRVICVHLALFADLMKARPWTPAALQKVGGPRGLVITYLSENLDTERAKGPRLAFCTAAQSILRGLLPPCGSDLRETTLSRTDLQKLAGMADDSRRFTDLLSWLDSELRLISPTQPADMVGTNRVSDPPSFDTREEAKYHLTHDFLVPAIRDWLRGRDLVTSEGRTRHLLTERSALWETHPVDALLPSAWEHLQIRLRTRPGDRSKGERRFLRRATHVQIRRGVWYGTLVFGLACLGVWIGGQLQERDLDQQATARVGELLHSRPEHWHELIRGLSEPRLKSRIARDLAAIPLPPKNEADPKPPQVALRLARLVALEEREQIPPLRDALLTATPEVIREVRPSLWESTATEELESLWEVAAALQSAGALRNDGSIQPTEQHDRALRAAVILAGGPADDLRWTALAPAVIDSLAGLSSDEVREWRALLQPVRRNLVPPLLAMFETREANSTERRFALEMLLDFARDDSATLCAALCEADPESLDRLLPAARRHHSEISRRLWAELGQSTAPQGSWNDLPDTNPRPMPAPAIVSEIEAAGGELNPEFGYCLQLPLRRVAPVCEALRSSGYRPVHLHSVSRNSQSGVASIVWNRDGLPWTLVDSVPVLDVLQEDRHQAAQGCEVRALLKVDPGLVTVLWSSPVTWGRKQKWSVGPRGRLHVTVERPPLIPGSKAESRVRYHSIPEEAWVDNAPDVDRVLQTPPLLEGDYAQSSHGLNEILLKFPGRRPRNLLAVGECEWQIDSRHNPLFLHALLVDGWRVFCDGRCVAQSDASGTQRDLQSWTPLHLAAGRHTLRVEFWWRELSPNSFCRMGVPRIDCMTDLGQFVPDWTCESASPVEPESCLVFPEPVFDVENLWVTDPSASSKPMRELVRRNFRPFRIRYFSPRKIRIDVCRPRPSYADVDRWAVRRARVALALLELEPAGEHDPWTNAVLAQLRPQPPPWDSGDFDATLCTELQAQISRLWRPNSPHWNHLRFPAAAQLPIDARQSLWLSLAQAGRPLSRETRLAWSQTLAVPQHWATE